MANPLAFQRILDASPYAGSAESPRVVVRPFSEEFVGTFERAGQALFFS